MNLPENPKRKINVVLVGQHASGKTALIQTMAKLKDWGANEAPAIVKTMVGAVYESRSKLQGRFNNCRFIDTCGRPFKLEDRHLRKVFGGLKIDTALLHEHNSEGTGWGDVGRVDVKNKADVVILVAHAKWSVSVEWDTKKAPFVCTSGERLREEYEFIDHVAFSMTGCGIQECDAFPFSHCVCGTVQDVMCTLS